MSRHTQIVRNIFCSLLTVAICCTCVVAYAQSVQTFQRDQLTPVTPDRDAQNFGEAPLAPLERSGSDITQGGPRFKLTGIVFEGSSVFSQAELAPVAGDLIGREVGFNDLQTLTRDIEQFYDDSGYLAVRAIVPAQEIDDGSVQISIIEGSIAQVVVRGELGGAAAAVDDLVQPLTGQKPLERATVERRLLLARDLAGVNLIAGLRGLSTDTPGALVLLVDAVHAPYDGFVSFSNLAPDTAGPYLGTIGAAANSLLLSGDRLEAVGFSTVDPSEQVLGQLSYQFPLGFDGLTGRLTFSNSVSEPDGISRIFDLDYRAYIGRADIDYALIRSRDRTVTLGASFEAVHQEQNATVAGLVIDEDLRVLGAHARWVEEAMVPGFLDAFASVRIGLPGLGSSNDEDDGVTGDPQFTVFLADIKHDVEVADRVHLRTRALGLTSTGNLPSYEAFSLGNYTIGRGFNPGSALGDHGIAGSVEVAYQPRFTEYRFLDRAEGYAFIDAGIAFDDGSAHLASGGVGVRVGFLENFDLDAFVAIPFTTSDLVSDDGVELLFRATAFF